MKDSNGAQDEDEEDSDGEFVSDVAAFDSSASGKMNKTKFYEEDMSFSEMTGLNGRQQRTLEPPRICLDKTDVLRRLKKMSTEINQFYHMVSMY